LVAAEMPWPHRSGSTSVDIDVTEPGTSTRGVAGRKSSGQVATVEVLATYGLGGKLESSADIGGYLLKMHTGPAARTDSPPRVPHGFAEGVR
jgi:hypothetical protein